MRITEDLFLLLTDDEGKVDGWGTYRGYGLVGAVVADLVVAGRVALSDDKNPRVTVTSQAPVGTPYLDAALERLVEQDGKRLSSLIPDGKLNPEKGVAHELAQRGVVRVEERRMLGLVPERYPVLDPQPERAVRDRLRAVLGGDRPTPAEATILSILHGLGVARTILKDESAHLSRSELTTRIQAAAADIPEGGAVGKAVQAMNAALMTAAILPAITSSTSS